jgi:hypothetical protein
MPAGQEAIAREIAEQRRWVGRLMAWLDQCPVLAEMLPPDIARGAIACC